MYVSSQTIHRRRHACIVHVPSHPPLAQQRENLILVLRGGGSTWGLRREKVSLLDKDREREGEREGGERELERGGEVEGGTQQQTTSTATTEGLARETAQVGVEKEWRRLTGRVELTHQGLLIDPPAVVIQADRDKTEGRFGEGCG